MAKDGQLYREGGSYGVREKEKNGLNEKWR